VLNGLVQSSGEASNDHYQQQVLNLNLRLGGQDLTPAADIEADCGEAEALAIEALRKQVEGRDSNDAPSFSVSQLAQDPITDPRLVAGSLAQASVVILHLDDPSVAEQPKPIRIQLTAKRGYIASGVRFGEPSSSSCGPYNSVHFFHRADNDNDLAGKLIAQINALKETSSAVRALLAGSCHTMPGLSPIDMSTWTYARCIPRAPWNCGWPRKDAAANRP
jgi:hypothetical protein